jgi:hypothetical protein
MRAKIVWGVLGLGLSAGLMLPAQASASCIQTEHWQEYQCIGNQLYIMDCYRGCSVTYCEYASCGIASCE